ncbi:transposase [Roseomonas hellenica]|uniref:Transposase n=1 Tax=Plastoroseomonas hellenica TaxID=2687306 RepID=A0ABS5F1W0_9PROT|nr:hypothetical protein [Plastoroseomonas hellenica]MBR0666573.1 transposase [Plastoroseomonas hellenica]
MKAAQAIGAHVAADLQDPRSGQRARPADRFVVTPGNVADISVAAALLEDIAPPQRLLADRAL